MPKESRDIAEIFETLDIVGWNGPVHTNMAGSATATLEDGKILYFPRLFFTLELDEQRFLSPAVADAKAKNVSLDPRSGVLKHAVGIAQERGALRALLERYRVHALALVHLLLPRYQAALEIGRTSFRPAEIAGRRLSAKKDDTRLHIDAFPSTPMGGKRILRVFTNVNPAGQGRQWRIGASFEEVARAFHDRIPKHSTFVATLLNVTGATKSYRTAYDHMMLGIHDTMKGDDRYQSNVTQNGFSFPPGSTWIVFTDKVSHAAMSGQHVFEQTFYLPVAAMADSDKAPLRILERLSGRLLT